MIQSFSEKIKTKLGQDILWCYASFAILAVSGVFINIIIAGAYGASALGVFNQAFAIYIMASQFAVAGVHFSVLKHVAEFVESPDKRNQIISSAVVLSLVMGMVTAIVVFFSRNLFGKLLESPEVTKGLVFVAPALIFFSLNKVLIAVLNGLRHMKAFAFAQASRYLLMIGFVIAASVSGAPGYLLTATFLVAELILFLILLLLVQPHFSFIRRDHWGDWFRNHLVFGGKGFLSGVLIEINTRVDVLMIGFFLSDQAVGIYTFAAMLAEGLYQLLVIVKNNLNPILAQLLSHDNFREIKSLVRKTQKIIYPIMAMIVLLVVSSFPFMVKFLYGEGVFLQSWPILGILAAGILISSGYIPFDGIFIQAGLPEYHTALSAMVIGSNIILNAVMIPFWGIRGAAVATGSSFVLGIIYLNFLVRNQLRFSLR
jgi:O-antigen/teichoic acid export membrane protein